MTMIITDINQIDRIVENVLGSVRSSIAVDMKDYAFIKEQSSSLKAVKVEISEITEKTLMPFDEALADICNGKECNVLLHISGRGDNFTDITIEQMQLIHESIERNIAEDTNMIWGLGECEGGEDGIMILVIVGNGE